MTRLIAVQLIPAIYFLNKNILQKDLVIKESVYRVHFQFSYLHFYLFTDD